VPEDPVIPHNGFATVEDGERAFFHLLRKAGVDNGWTWEQTMRTIITDPLYKALNTLAEKKAAWQKVRLRLVMRSWLCGLTGAAVHRRAADERRGGEGGAVGQAPADAAKYAQGQPERVPIHDVPDCGQGLRATPHLAAGEGRGRAKTHIRGVRQRAQAEGDGNGHLCIICLQALTTEQEQQRAAHGRAITKVVTLFKDLQIDVLTKWRDAHRRLVESPEWRADKELQELPNLDILLAFEDFSRVQEREFEEQLRRAQVDKARRERKAREAFRALLGELVQKGALRARRKWKQVYPEFADDARFQDLLGQPGSNPLELFWDVVDGLDQRLDAKIAVVAAAIQAHDDAAKARGEVRTAEEGEEPRGFVVGPESRLDELLAVVSGDQGVKEMDPKDVEEVFYAVRIRATWLQRGLTVVHSSAKTRGRSRKRSGGRSSASSGICRTTCGTRSRSCRSRWT
jgi:pre-mRNA-processing factor 40